MHGQGFKRKRKASRERKTLFIFSPSGGAFDRQMAHLSKPKLCSGGRKLLADGTLAM